MATVQIIIKDDAGATLDDATAEMPLMVLELGIDAIAKAYGYQAQVANPAFAPALAEDADNVRMIPNPMSKYRFFSTRMRLFAEQHAEQYVREQAQSQAFKAAGEQFKAIASQILVK